jgi:geranylgeranyl reductase family protein
VDHCDVLIVGGGPAGSSCAWKLREAGVDVAVIDKAAFPRDKVCAGWITPQVIDELQLDTRSYRAGRTFQPITSFRVGVIGRERTLDTAYHRPISFGIRRCEFDDYLLRRSGARLLLGESVASIRRSGTKWVVNDRVEASMLVGAAGHFCPVARILNAPVDRTPLVAAQEAEFPIDAGEADRYAVDGEKPELYFTCAFDGYGWCFRKGDHLNVGFGRLNARALPADSAGFVRFLEARRAVPMDLPLRWRGHAYLVSTTARPRVVENGVVLAGDAAGLAYPQSGEGIRPAIESGLLAAAAIVQASGRYSRDRLEPYARALHQRFASGGGPMGWLSLALPSGLAAAIGPHVLRSRWMVRHLVLDRWFLHAADHPIH